MKYHVYMIMAKRFSRYYTYVGYTVNLEKRLELHNSSKGAKYTRGKKWYLIHKKSYSSRAIAMKEEYILKKNYKLRTKLKREFLINENINIASI